MDVDDVEFDPPEKLVERAADVERHGRDPRTRAAGHRESLADREHRHAVGAPLRGQLEDRVRIPVERGADRAPRVADRGSRVGRSRDEHPMAALGELGATFPTNSLTSWYGPHVCGVTWAIERRSRPGTRAG